MASLGHDTRNLKQRVKNQKSLSGVDVLKHNQGLAQKKKIQKKQAPVNQNDRLSAGVADGALRSQAERVAKLQRRERNRQARLGEADRHTVASMPKHLFSGKRGFSADRR